LGEDGVYYGVRFGKQIPWVQKFPFGYIRDPQYVGSSLSLLGCLYWVQWPYVVIWILGYLFLSHVESVEDVTSRAKLPKALKT
jgi:methylene-fatty-acyl-phospholipid synthase